MVEPATPSGTPRITALRRLKREPPQIAIMIGKKRFAVVFATDVSTLGLAVDRTIDAALSEKILEAQGRLDAWRDAMRLINRRAYSTGQLRDKLRQRGHSSHHIEPLIDVFIEKRWLDDEQFASRLVEQWQTHKQVGPQWMRQKLYQRRVPRAVIDKTLAEQHDPDQDEQAAMAFLEKQLARASVQKLEPQKRQRRLYAAMQRRGFSLDVIRRAMQSQRDMPMDDASDRI